MPLLCVPRECDRPNEHRTALVPADIARLQKLGLEVAVESGLGEGIDTSDADYQAAGARILKDRAEVLSSADILFRLHPTEPDQAGQLKAASLHMSMLDPFRFPDHVVALRDAKVAAFSMNMVPRITRAQPMDALTSQANLAGYSAVIRAAFELRRIFPMMMTAAGTIQPARVFIIGVGVAGLQAIAVAKRLGARVEAFDTRPVVAEQVRSLGARFVEVDLGETGETAGGYARELTPEQIETQRREMARVCARSDVVITAAQVFGRRAPVIVTAAMLDDMRPGSVVVDTAVEGGGNVEGIEPGKVIVRKGVRLVGQTNLPSDVSAHASQMYSANLCALLEDVWDLDSGAPGFDPEDEIQAGCMLTRDGTIVHEAVAKVVAESAKSASTKSAESAPAKSGKSAGEKASGGAKQGAASAAKKKKATGKTAGSAT